MGPGDKDWKAACEGCLLGLATGDALGAPHEGGLLERLLWRWIGRTASGEMRWTDDTQMTIDLVESWLARGRVDPDDLARRFASSYRWSRGYGPGAARVLGRIRRGEHWEKASRVVRTEGSFGNGASMRAAVLALMHPADEAGLVASAEASARVTHAHPQGVEGAVVMARAARWVLRGMPAVEVSADCATGP